MKNNSRNRRKERQTSADLREVVWNEKTIDEQIATNPGPRVIAKLEVRKEAAQES